MFENVYNLCCAFNQTAEKCKADYNMPEFTTMSPYDEKDANGNFIVPQERIEADIKLLTSFVMGYYHSCNNAESYDTFMMIFASYCNFYILKGLVCRSGLSDDTFFGLSKYEFSKAYNGLLLPYMQAVFTGIYQQNYQYFVEAVKIISNFHIAYVYLFVYNTTYYFKLLNDSKNQSNNTDSNRINVYGNKMWYIYNYCLQNDECRQYIIIDKNNSNNIYLPFIHFMDNQTVINSDNILNKFVNVLYSASQENNIEILQNIGEYSKANKKRLNEMTPLPRENVTDWHTDYQTRENNLNLLNGIFVNNASTILFQFFENGRMANCNYQQARLLNNQLEQAIKDNKEVINKFSHTYKNMSATTLHEVAEALMSSEDPEIKKHGKKVLLEYGIKQTLTKDIEILQLCFENQIEVLYNKIKRTMCSCKTDESKTLRQILSDAFNRCMITTVYDATSKGKPMRAGLRGGKERLSVIGQEFQDKVLFMTDCDVFEWFSKFFPTSCTVSSAWENLYFEKDNYAAVMITSLLTELTSNMFKYADKLKNISYQFTEDENSLIIIIKNYIKSDIKKLDDSGLGLSSNEGIIKLLNKIDKLNEKAIVAQKHEDGTFTTKVTINKQILSYIPEE